MAPSCTIGEALSPGRDAASRARCSVHAAARVETHAAARKGSQRIGLPEEEPGHAHARFRLAWNVAGVQRACDIEADAAAGRVGLVAKRHPHLPGIGTERNAVLVMEPVLDPSRFHAERARAEFSEQRLRERRVRLGCANLHREGRQHRRGGLEDGVAFVGWNAERQRSIGRSSPSGIDAKRWTTPLSGEAGEVDKERGCCLDRLQGAVFLGPVIVILGNIIPDVRSPSRLRARAPLGAGEARQRSGNAECRTRDM